MAELITRGFLERQFKNYSETVDETFTRKADAVRTLNASIDNNTFIMTFELVDQNGTKVSTKTIDLPLETVVISGAYDSATKTLNLKLKNGNNVSIPLKDLISGLLTDDVTVAGLTVKTKPTASQLAEKLSDASEEVDDIDFSTVFAAE